MSASNLDHEKQCAMGGSPLLMSRPNTHVTAAADGHISPTLNSALVHLLLLDLVHRWAHARNDKLESYPGDLWNLFQLN